MKHINKNWLYIIPTLTWSLTGYADYKTDIGYTDLQTLLGANTPNGAGVNVLHIEASSVGVTDPTYPIYSPNVNDPIFTGKSITFPSVASTTVSGHANWVGGIFYGNTSMANGITNITSYEANAWLSSIAFSSVSAPFNGSRIANDSWVGSDDTQSGLILRLTDRETQLTDLIQVVGMANSQSTNPLLSSAYNVIAVGRTDGGAAYGSSQVDSVYVSGRTRPDLVTPETLTSASTPEVSATAALLVQTGHNAGLNLSKESNTITGVGIVYNAERAVTIKAALMAGADRVTNNTSTTANIYDYGTNGHLSNNGLDDRFGAGQVNVLHSYQIISGGEQNSLEDGGSNNGNISLNGFDYDSAFGGGLGSNKTATYKFNATTDSTLTASLVWNIGVANNASLATTLHHLNLELFDVSTNSSKALSASTIDNTQNIWTQLVTGHNYELLVKSGEATNFSWNYALAWHINPTSPPTPAPIPNALYLFGSALFIGYRFLKSN